MKDKVELLLPAGNKEKLDYAINYGADAVYMGMVDFRPTLTTRKCI